eukprot:SAG31_NODE_922_length_10976_cov_8.838742_6_plen_166_part_00
MANRYSVPGGQRFPQSAMQSYMVDTFSISALHISIKVPYFSHSGHKNEKVTNYLVNNRWIRRTQCHAFAESAAWTAARAGWRGWRGWSRGRWRWWRGSSATVECRTKWASPGCIKAPISALGSIAVTMERALDVGVDNIGAGVLFFIRCRVTRSGSTRAARCSRR